MVYTANRQVKRDWAECPREARESRWAAMYVTLNPDGDIVMSRFTHERTGSPESYVLLFDRATKTIGMRAARPVEKNAYPARPRGRHGGRRIRGYRLCKEFGIKVPRTVRFSNPHLDTDGVLILDLHEARLVKNGDQ
jgi:hypothetical protein